MSETKYKIKMNRVARLLLCCTIISNSRKLQINSKHLTEFETRFKEKRNKIYGHKNYLLKMIFKKEQCVVTLRDTKFHQDLFKVENAEVLVHENKNHLKFLVIMNKEKKQFELFVPKEKLFNECKTTE